MISAIDIKHSNEHPNELHSPFKKTLLSEMVLLGKQLTPSLEDCVLVLAGFALFL